MNDLNTQKANACQAHGVHAVSSQRLQLTSSRKNGSIGHSDGFSGGFFSRLFTAHFPGRLATLITAFGLLLVALAPSAAQTSDCWTTLHAEVAKNPYYGQKSSIEKVKSLIKFGADVNAGVNECSTSLDNQGATPLSVAAYYGNDEVVKVLIKAGADVNAKDGDGMTALHSSAGYRSPSYNPDHSGHDAVVKILIKAGAHVNVKANDGGTPLHRAVMAVRYETIKTLIEAGAEVTAGADIEHGWMVNAGILNGVVGYAGYSWGNTEIDRVHHLHQNQITITKMLIKAGADVNAGANEGWSPLLSATESNAPPGVYKALIEAGADVNIKASSIGDGDPSGDTPLLLAAANLRYAFHIEGHEADVIKTLIAAGADVNARNSFGVSPLFSVFTGGLNPYLGPRHDDSEALNAVVLEGIKALIAAGADVNVRVGDEALRDGESNMLLHMAIRKASVGVGDEVVEALIAAGADVNARDRYNWLPLEMALRPSNSRLVKALLAAGAEVKDENEWFLKEFLEKPEPEPEEPYVDHCRTKAIEPGTRRTCGIR